MGTIFVTQAQLDAISDDFQSTFSQLKRNVLANCFAPYEQARVTEIIQKHVPEAVRIVYSQQDEIAENYFVYEVELYDR